MKFITDYDLIERVYSAHSDDNVTMPNQAMSPKQIIDRFVKSLPLPQTSQPSGQVNNDIDHPSPFQGQEYDKIDALQYAIDHKNELEKS